MLLSGKETTRWKSDAVIEIEEVPDNVVLLDDKRKESVFRGSQKSS